MPEHLCGRPPAAHDTSVDYGKLARRLEVDTLDVQVEILLLLRRAGLIEHALRTREHAPGPRHPDTAQSVWAVLAERQQHERALDLPARARGSVFHNPQNPAGRDLPLAQNEVGSS